MPAAEKAHSAKERESDQQRQRIPNDAQSVFDEVLYEVDQRKSSRRNQENG